MTHERFIAILNEKIDNRVDVLASGRCETLQQYTHACGEILGLRSARNEYIELLKEHNKELDDKNIA